MKVFHLADLHASAKTLDQVMRCCDFSVQQAQEQRPDLIILAGDTYDSRDIRLDSETCKYVFGFVRLLSDIAPVFIVRGTPFHEGNAIETLQYVGGRFPVVVSGYPGTWVLLDSGNILPFGGVIASKVIAMISSMPTPTKQYLEDDLNIKASNDNLASALTPIFAKFSSDASQYPDVPHILAGHFCVRGAAISETQTMIGKDIEIGRDQIEMAKIDLGCFGHIHLRQQLWSGCFYSGSFICKTHGETDIKGFYVHELSDKMSTQFLKASTFIPTPVDKLLRIRHDFTAEDNPDISLALQKYRSDELRGAHLKIELTLWQDQCVEWDKKKVLSHFVPFDCNSIDISISRLPHQNIRNEQILRADSLTEKISILAVQNKEEISQGIIDKCELLQSTPQEEIIKQLEMPTKKEFENGRCVAIPKE